MTWPTGRARDGGLDQVPVPGAGALWLCGKRVTAPDPEAALRRAGGAEAIVCFNERAELLREHAAYVEWLDANDGGRALWFPVADLHAPGVEQATGWVDVMVDRLDAGQGLVLHCAGGIGRAPTMAICVLIALGMTAEAACDHVAAHRPMAGPEVGAQRDLVHAFARRLTTPGTR